MANTTTEWPTLGAASAWQGDFAPLVDEAARGNFDPLAERILQTRGDWDARIVLLECIVRDRFPETALTAWHARHAGRLEAELLLGAARLSWAEASRRAPAVPGVDAGAARQAKLVAAEQSFLRAFPLDAADPSAGVFLLRASGPLGRPQEALGRVFAQTNQRDPGNVALHLAYLDTLLPPRTTDPGAALAWAQQISSQCPPGLELHMLVVQAHVRRWEAAFASTGSAEGAASVLTPAARNDVVAACERSIHHPSFAVQRSSVYLWNLAAFWYYLAADRVRLTRELQLVGPRYTPEPWATRAGGDARRGYSRAIDTARGRGLSGFLLLVGGPKNALRGLAAVAAVFFVFFLGSYLLERPAPVGQTCKFDGDCSSSMCLGPVGNSYCSHDCTGNAQCGNVAGAGSFVCQQTKETLHPTGQKPLDAIVHACVPRL